MIILLYKDSELLFIEKFQLYISGTNIDATEYDFKKALDLLRYIDKVIKADLVYKPQNFPLSSIIIFSPSLIEKSKLWNFSQ